ncbi:hypothetical protein AHAS_Ahas19G0385700 [Arachis hypogaea]
MYQPSSSSSSSSQAHNSTVSEPALTRYGSAPGSLLRTAVDAVIAGGAGGPRHPHPLMPTGSHYFSGESSESTSKVNDNSKDHNLHRSYGLQQDAFAGSSSSSSSLLRQRSSPAGFLSNLADNAGGGGGGGGGGFTITRGGGGSGGGNYGSNSGRLKSQMSFTGQDSLSQISEVSESVVVDASTSERAYAMDHCWDNSNSNSSSIVFSAPPSKRSKNIDGDILNCLTALDSQYSLPQTALEMATMEKLMHIPEDSVPCKIRAKRGCATHPRSIAERERRTRISGKLKKLQELVPNMDKQTSYADMLDLAVQHIKGLQTQVQKETFQMHQGIRSFTLNLTIALVDANQAHNLYCSPRFYGNTHRSKGFDGIE